jgi:DNA-binding transcriptional regulator of glucitol operon
MERAMEILKSFHRNFGSNKPFIYQNTATMEPPVQAESEAGPPKPGIPEHLKEQKTKEEQHVVFDEKTKKEAQKMGFFQKLKATLFPAKASKKEGEKREKIEGEAIEKPTDKKTEAREIREAEKIYREGLATIKDLIAPASMEFMYDKMKISGLFAKSFFVYAYPRYIEANWLSPIINFDVSMDISIFVYPTSSIKIMKFLKNKVAQIQSTMRMEQEKGMVSDPALETALQDAEELRRNIQRGEEKFFQFGLYFTIYGEDEEKLQKIQTKLESALGGKLVLTKSTDLQMEHGFNSSIPLCMDEIEVTRNMNTNPLSASFPFSSAELTSDKGILYGINRHNDSLIIFDRFNLENANSVVFAKSGAGKSYAVKLEVLRSMMMGTDVIIIDPENEYEELANTVDGTYLRVSLNSDQRINPFDLPAPIDEEDEKPGELLRSNIITLHGLLNLMLGKMTPEEEGLMDKALIDTYALKGITMDTLNPASVEPPTMEDLHDILSNMKGSESLAKRLQKYTVGTFAGIFNKPTNVNLKSGLVVFCIRDLEDMLRPIAMYIILNHIWNTVRSELKRRILVIDEAWSMMQYEDSARFLYGLVKRARKYFLGITTITQDVEDFIESNYGKPIITNSSLQILLKQSPSAMNKLTEIFNLTEGEKYLLLNANIGQGLFFAGLKHVAIQIIASYNEDKIITTNPEEILAQREQSEEKFKKKEEIAETEPAPEAPVTDTKSTESVKSAEETLPPPPPVEEAPKLVPTKPPEAASGGKTPPESAS